MFLADGDAIQAKLLELSGQKTVPSIYIRQKHVGGFSDLNSLNESGDLKSLLSSDGNVLKSGAGDITVATGFIKSNPIAVFSKSWCPFCKKVSRIFHSWSMIHNNIVDINTYSELIFYQAKELLDQHNAVYGVVELDLSGMKRPQSKLCIAISKHDTCCMVNDSVEKKINFKAVVMNFPKILK